MADADRETVQSTSDDPAFAPTSRTTSPPGEAYRPGDQIGARYRVTGFLGRGGMGAVYLAHDELLGDEVALKLVGDALTPEHLERLRGEVLLAQKVTHPAVCRTYDLEEVDHRWLIKMEYVDGESLATRLRAGPLPIAEVLRIAREIADGLASAHRRHVIHRDLKPHNVMLERGTKRVVLMDFGVARRIDPDGAVEEIAGTPGYMAPEQASRNRVDARTDVYALGCVIYQMLTGVLPFPASTVLQAADRPAQVPDPSAARAEAPAWLVAIVVQMLDADPARRPGDAAAVLALLAGPPPRRGMLWIAAGTAAASVAAFAAIAATRAGPPEPAVTTPPPPPAPWQADVTEVGPPVEENIDGLAVSPDGLRVVYSSKRGRTAMRLYVSPIGSTEVSWTSPPGVEVIHASWARDGASIIGSLVREQTRSVRYSLAEPRIERLGFNRLSVCGDHYITIRAASDCADCEAVVAIGPGDTQREIRHTVPFGSIVDIPACDASGDHVAFSLSPTRIPLQPPCDLFVASRDGVKQLTHGGENRYPSFARSGKTIVFSSAPTEGALHVWEVPIAGGTPVQRTTGPGNDFAPVVTPDDHTLTFNLDQTVQTVWAYDGKARHRDRISPSQADLTALAVAPDGRLLVTRTTLAGDEMVELTPVDGSTHAVAKGREAVATSHGDAIAFVQIDDKTSRISTMSADGVTREIATLDGEANALYVDAQRIVHAEVARGSERVAIQVPFDGSSPPRNDDPRDRFVLPAPTGWVLHLLQPSRKAGKTMTRVIAGVARLDPPPGSSRPSQKLGDLVEYAAWNATGTVVVFFENGTVHRFDVIAARDEVIAKGVDVVGVAVSPDGKTVYTLEVEGHVRRMLVKNFGDRPPP